MGVPMRVTIGVADDVLHCTSPMPRRRPASFQGSMPAAPDARAAREPADWCATSVATGTAVQTRSWGVIKRAPLLLPEGGGHE